MAIALLTRKTCDCGGQYSQIPGRARFNDTQDELRGYYWECLNPVTDAAGKQTICQSTFFHPVPWWPQDGKSGGIYGV